MNVETILSRGLARLGLNALQLSHVLMNVETVSTGEGIQATEKGLQLSHVLMNVETFDGMDNHDRITTASIEPRSYERGNPWQM